MKVLTSLFLLLIISLFFPGAGATDPIKIHVEAHDPWVREAPPMARVMAGYLMLHNHSEKTLSLKTVSSPQFAHVEIHRSEMKNSMAIMTPVTRIMLTDNDMAVFEPGGLHLMLIEPKQALHAGDSVQLSFHFNDGNTLSIQAPVKKTTDTEDHSGHNMNNMHNQQAHEPMHDKAHDSHR